MFANWFHKKRKSDERNSQRAPVVMQVHHIWLNILQHTVKRTIAQFESFYPYPFATSTKCFDSDQVSIHSSGVRGKYSSLINCDTTNNL